MQTLPVSQRTETSHVTGAGEVKRKCNWDRRRENAQKMTEGILLKALQPPSPLLLLCFLYIRSIFLELSGGF